MHVVLVETDLSPVSMCQSVEQKSTLLPPCRGENDKNFEVVLCCHHLHLRAYACACANARVSDCAFAPVRASAKECRSACVRAGPCDRKRSSPNAASCEHFTRPNLAAPAERHNLDRACQRLRIVECLTTSASRVFASSCISTLQIHLILRSLAELACR